MQAKSPRELVFVASKPYATRLVVAAVVWVVPLANGVARAGSSYLQSSSSYSPSTAAGYSVPTQAPASSLGSPVVLSTLTNGGSLVVGDKLFSGFVISGSISAADVTVTPIEDSFGYGIEFSGGFAALGNETQDMVLGYTVTVTTNSPDLISDVHLLFNGLVTGTGLAEVVEQVSTLDFVFIGQTAVFATATTNQLADTLEINPPQRGLVISKDVLLTARVDGTASISTIDQTFSQVLIPEPSALTLSALGLLTIFGLLRRCFRFRR